MFGIGRFFWKRDKKIGLPPGTPIFVGEKQSDEVKISVIEFNESRYEKMHDVSIDSLKQPDESMISWININGIHDVPVIEKIGDIFAIHPLTLEDVMNSQHQPKTDDFGDYIFIIIKMLSYDKEAADTRIEQLSLILKDRLVISFQEREGDFFEPIRNRIHSGAGRVRKMGADYLAYLLLDTVVDHYYIVLERYSDLIEEIEEQIVTQAEFQVLSEIHRLKKEMLFLRRSVWPLRDLITFLERGDNTLITKPTRLFFRDVNDHIMHAIGTVDIFRDMLAGMHDTYLSSVSNKMNDVMKMLTVIATIFIPLTFLAGIYGMNFKFMPELQWHWGYLSWWAVNIIIVVGMIFVFKRKRIL